jgi:hypothetical protein
MKKTLRFEKERRVFPFGEGFEASAIPILQPETAFHVPTLLVCFRVEFCCPTEETGLSYSI